MVYTTYVIPNDGAGEGVSRMENSASVPTPDSRSILRRNFTRWKEKPIPTNNCLEVLAHYDAELVQDGGPIMVVRRRTGTALPLEHKAKIEMVKLLLDEFRTVDGANEAIGNYKASHS